jgi:WD40 repeat protein
MHISVVAIGGIDIASFCVESSTTVQHIKQYVYEAIGTKPEQQKLIFKDAILTCTCSLAECGIETAAVLTLVILPPPVEILTWWQHCFPDMRSTIEVWSFETGTCNSKQILAGHSSFIYHVTVSADGRSILSASHDNTAKLWSLDSEECTQTFIGHEHSVYTANLAFQGTLVVTASADKKSKVWDKRSGVCVKDFPHEIEVTNAMFAPDGMSVLTTCDNPVTTRLWSIERGTCLQIFCGEAIFSESCLYMCTILQDVVTLLTTGDEEYKVLWTLRESHPPINAAFSWDCSHILVAFSVGAAKLLDLASGDVVQTFTRDLEDKEWSADLLGFSRGGTILMACQRSSRVEVWDVIDAKLLRSFLHDAEDALASAMISRDGAMVLTVGL